MKIASLASSAGFIAATNGTKFSVSNADVFR